MNLSISFNWPLGEDSVAVDFGQPNVNDAEIEFRIGVVPEKYPDKVAWHKSGWVVGSSAMTDIQFLAKRGDTIIVERRKSGMEKVETRNSWNIDEHWPAEAYGASMTVVPWTL